MDQKYINSTMELCDFISESPTAFHAAANACAMLDQSGFKALDEKKPFCLEHSGSYYVKRNGSAVVAFSLPETKPSGFTVVAAHTDSPSFKLKANPEVGGAYTTLNVEAYGGMLMAPWFDRPLSVAGRAFVRTEQGRECRLVDIDRDICQIVNLCIHQNRNANNGYEYHVQPDMFPIIGTGDRKGAIKEMVAEQLEVEADDIIDMELFLYNRQKGSVWGVEDEFFSAPRIDDLMCVHSAVKSLCECGTSASDKVQLVCLFDNEEVGSGTKQGAEGTFLSSVMDRIMAFYGMDCEQRAVTVANSFMLSADNGHSFHPNYPQTSDLTNHPVMNGGVLIKYAGNQKYTTDADSASHLKDVLTRAEVPFQLYFNNSNQPGGSTLGNISQVQVSMSTVDIGAAQLAMHSPYETAGVKDAWNLTCGMTAVLEE